MTHPFTKLTHLILRIRKMRGQDKNWEWKKGNERERVKMKKVKNRGRRTKNKESWDEGYDCNEGFKR